MNQLKQPKSHFKARCFVKPCKMYMPLKSMEIGSDCEVTSVVVIGFHGELHFKGDDVIIENSINMSDCEGVEMYEGDVIDDPERLFYDGTIEFYDGCYGVVLIYDLIFTPLEGWDDEWMAKVKVIGKTHFLTDEDRG